MPSPLQTQFDSRKSFYGKAKVLYQKGKLVLESYGTNVAEIVNGKPRVFGTYSTTTLRHIKEFLKQNGFKAENTKQIMKDYGASEYVYKETTPFGKSSDNLNVVKETRSWN